MYTRFYFVVRLFALVLSLGFVNAIQAQPPSFSYSSPVCNNVTQLQPQLSAPFPAGGTYTATGTGLFLNPVSGQINPAFSLPGSYTISYTGSSCNCTLTATVQVLAAPLVTISNYTACFSQEASVTLVASPSTAAGYTWMPMQAFTYSNTISINNLQTQHVVYVEDQNGCMASGSVTGIVYQTPTVGISSAQTVCAGSPVSLVATGASMYSWSTGQNLTIITVTPQINTTYTVEGFNLQGCRGFATRHIQVIPGPQMTAGNTTACANQSVTLSASSSATNLNYLWQPGGLTGAQITVSPAATMVYTVTASPSGLGCSVKRTVTVQVSPSYTPSIGFYYNTPLCTNSADPLPILPPDFAGGGKFESDLEIDPETGKLGVLDQPPGTYIVNYSVAAKGCTMGLQSTHLVEIKQAVKTSLPEHITIVEGQQVRLTVLNAENLAWTPADFLSCTDCTDPVASPPQTTRYCAEGHINGCWMGACTTVEVTCYNQGDFSVPNAFTPNKDGNNEKFCLQGWEKCISNFSVQIFNRWGELVYSSRDPNFCWDGTHNGTLLNADVFVYVIRGTHNKDPEMVKRGNITLIR